MKLIDSLVRLRVSGFGVVGLLLPLATLPAAEMVRQDLSMAIEGLPTPFDFSVNQDGGGTRNGADTFDHAVGLRIGPQWGSAKPGSQWGWIAGAELGVADYAYASYLTYQTVGVNLMGGGAWAFADRWQATLAPVIGYGFGRASISATQQFHSAEASGSHITYGLRSGLTYAWNREWMVGAEVGYLTIRSSLDVDGGRTMTLDQAGPAAALTVAWRWSSRPAPLE